MNRRRRRLLAGGCVALAIPRIVFAGSSEFPQKPIKVIVPFPPGAGSDILTRLVAQEMAKVLGQQLVIENRAGAAGNIGAAAAARMDADGYSLLAAPSSLVASSVLYANLPFDLDRDFDPIAMLGAIPFVLVIRDGISANTVVELVRLAKYKPDSLTYASTGNGSAPHLVTESFNLQAGIRTRHIPYKGSAPALNDLLGGQVDMMFSNLLSVVPQIKGRKLRALGIATRTRSQDLPAIPTFIESGFAGFEWSTWAALMAPHGTPAAVIERLNAAVQAALRVPGLAERLREQGADAQTPSVAETATFIRNERIRLVATVKAANMHFD
jgi:tripartite-type tricarboxylate transporter receptor subunit TctC